MVHGRIVNRIRRRIGAWAKAIPSVDTLEGFLREMQIHYPDAGTTPAPAAALDGKAANAPPAVETPSASPAPPARASGRSAQR